MHILFSGSSSFTGFWFIQELMDAGHKVIATFQFDQQEYKGIRKKRVDSLLEVCDCHFGLSFGGQAFQKLLEQERFDMYCHHAAFASNYQSKGFPLIKALQRNTACIEEVLDILKAKGCKKIVLTGSVFEQQEGEVYSRAVSPYGLSKGLTSSIFRYFCDMKEVQLSKFMIPNPFGPLEEEKFTSYLAKNWLDNKEPVVRHPHYVRDNIPISLLAKAYVAFLEQSFQDSAMYRQQNPSFYKESQEAFTKRFSVELTKRLNISCSYVLEEQKEFLEPLERVNTEPLDVKALKFDEKKFWDELATYYAQKA
jgi:UDP-glucose 4-epimerase